jgi:uroporphyrinogen III methyltransferase / synthase
LAVTPDGPGVLSGRTVVVTRSGPRAAGLHDALEREGATTIELALTEQVDPSDGGAALRAAAAAAGFAWLVFTSAHAVARFVAAAGRDAPGPGGAHVAAVGPATADALTAAGLEPDLVPAVHSARGLVEEFPTAAGGGSRLVLFPAGDLAPGTLEEGLRKKGWDVERVEAYRTVAASAPDASVLARVATADALVLFAASSVRAFIALRTEEGEAVPVPAHVVGIGASTVEAARSAGMTGVHEARAASPEGVVAELCEHFGPSGPSPRPGSGSAAAS